MHGLSIMQGLLDAVAENAFERGIAKVDHVQIAVGELAGVAPEELSFAFSLIVRGTMLEGASLEIVPVREGRDVRVVCYEGED